MCDPMTAGIIGAVGSMASSVISYSSQMSAMKAQEEANTNWVSYQREKSQQEWARQEQMRKRAEAARLESVDKLAPEQQKEAQETEQKRLTEEVTPEMLDKNPQLIGDKLLSGQGGATAETQSDIAARVADASREARKRIAALATLTSYGSSQFGLQNRANDIFRQSGQEIQHGGNLRQGSLAAYGVEKQVEPRRIQATPSPWGGIASGLASIAGRGLGGGTFGGSY